MKITSMQQPDTDKLEQVYKKYEDKHLPRSSSQEHPVAIITGGQPGSGKSGLSESAKAELRDKGGFVLVDADKLREHHPDYDELMQLNDKQAADITHPVASAWSRRLTEAGIEGRRNLIIDQTSRDPEALSKRAAQLRQAGYRVELRVKAVNPLQSEQFIRLRYEEKKAQFGFGRFTPQINHDTTFIGIPNSIERIEQERAVDRIALYDVNGKQIYENRLINGKWEHKPAGREALEAERSRPFNAIERQKFTQAYEKIIGLMEKRCATKAEISTVKARWQEAEKQLDAKPLLIEKGGTYEGKILLVDNKYISQQTAEGVVRHERAILSGTKMDELLKPGQQVSIRYPCDRAGIVTEAKTPQLQRQEKQIKAPSLGKK